jgi:hypothetical protein
MKKTLKTIGLTLLITLTFSACSETYNYNGNGLKYMKYQDKQITNRIVKDNKLDKVEFHEIFQNNGIVNIDYKREDSFAYGKNGGKYISGVDAYSICPIDYYLAKRGDNYLLEIDEDEVVEWGRKKYIQVLNTCIQTNFKVKKLEAKKLRAKQINKKNKLNEAI